MKMEESRDFCQLNRGKDQIYFDVGVVKRTTYRATELTTISDRVKDLSAKRIEMATKLNHEAVLRLLFDDVASNELYYHNKCYDTIRYRQSKFFKFESDKSSNMRDTKCDQITLKKVIFYLKDCEMSNLGNLYPVIELETTYYNVLKSDSIRHNNQTATFADLLVKCVPCLNKKTANKGISVFFDTAAIGLDTSSETYFDSLVRVTGSIRNAMHRKCQGHSSSLNVDPQSHLIRYLLNWCN